MLLVLNRGPDPKVNHISLKILSIETGEQLREFRRELAQCGSERGIPRGEVGARAHHEGVERTVSAQNGPGGEEEDRRARGHDALADESGGNAAEHAACSEVDESAIMCGGH